MTPEEYAAKRAAKAERYRQLADKATGRSNAAYRRSKSLTEHIVFGQPILVGHYSERKHRNALDKSWKAMGKSVEESKKADYYAQRAESAENNKAISSDDPEAVTKLKEKISAAEAHQAKMKKVNGLIRAKDIDGVRAIMGVLTDKILDPAAFGGPGYPSFELTNNNANISRMKKRLAQLEKTQVRGSAEYEIDCVRVVENVDDNRLQLFFDDKPDEETRKRCKSWAFKWSPTNGCWQRQLNTLGNNARTIATRAIRKE